MNPNSPAIPGCSKDRLRGCPKAPHVALLVETSLRPGRDILRGITQFIREHESWSLYQEPRGLSEGAPVWLKTWKGDGIIVRVQNLEIVEAVKATGLPVVDVLGVVPDAGLPVVHVDDAAIARMVAEHFLERGFHCFGFYGISGENWSERRLRGFQSVLEPVGTVHSYEIPRADLVQTPWEVRQDILARWLVTLPKPIGILVASDQLGPQLLEACRRAEISVPSEVSVVGVDNDETLCNVCSPPLSSVDASHMAVGYHAAALLRQLMAGVPPPPGPTSLQPSGLVVRTSSDVLATEDRHVAEALALIRERACDGLSAMEVVARIPVSRSVLQRRFRQEVGTSIQGEIIRTRLNRARQLLAETRLPLLEVAERSGFKHQEYLGATFKAHLGKTPAVYRREAQRGGQLEGSLKVL